MNQKKNITGYPSLDKPWLDKYPVYMFGDRKKYSSIYERLCENWGYDNEIIINYYDTLITSKEFFDKVDRVAKSLHVIGVKEGDSIAVSLEAVPEFLELFLACELLGCSIKNFMESIENNIELIQGCSSDIYITHDYISKDDVEKIYECTGIKHIILIDPLFSATNRNGIRDNIYYAIQERYIDERSFNEKNIEWKDFIQMGINVEKLPSIKNGNVLFSAFTSGTSGKAKEVLHSSETLLGVIGQLALSPSHEKGKDTWLLTILPPTLVAVVAAMMFYPLVDGKQLILDPFCRVEDLDLEMMHYEPNCWALIPMFFNSLIESKRIPDNYDMGYFKLFGFGAEPMTNKFISKVQKFLDEHNCKAPFSSGYGQSEGGSGFTVCIDREMMAAGSAGMPYIDTIISIFKPGTDVELRYNEVGEICKAGPGLMIGYADGEKTEEALKEHKDGKVWLHTGDYGFMTPEGLLFVLGRKPINIFPNKMVWPLLLENKVLLCSGIKDAVIVSGRDSENIDYEVPYLFVVLEDKQDGSIVLNELKEYIENTFMPEETPKAIYVIDRKPMSHFKTDRRFLQEEYKLF